MIRLVDETKTYDYSTKSEFEKHKNIMCERGFVLVDWHEWKSPETAKTRFNATFERGALFNGYNGRGNRDNNKFNW